MERLLAILTELTKLPKQELTPALDLFEVIDAPAKKPLLIPGTVCREIWLVGSGALRSYYVLEERKRVKPEEGGEGRAETVTREVTNWIVPPDGLYADMQSFLPQAPSSCYVEPLQDSRLLTLSRPNYGLLSEAHPRIGLKIFEQVSIMSELRIRISNFRHPEDRLRMFEAVYPGMTAVVSVNVLASWLNVDPNTLSKLRVKKR